VCEKTFTATIVICKGEKSHLKGAMKMVELSWIREALLDRRPKVVAERTGLHVNTITRIRDGKETNPKINTLNLLAVYLMGEGA
jgi:transcriptional regulator with XRE-family HTH domain